MTPVEQWNQYFAEKFPEGAIITFLRGAETAAPSDNSVQFATDRILTVEVENDHPEITFTDFGTNRNFILDLESIEERDFGIFAKTTETSQPNILISHNLSDSLKAALKEEAGQ